MSHSLTKSGSETGDRLLKVMSILYCQSIAADFRKPVEILYPNMSANYLSIIKHPMDLGTLLLECMKRTATIDSIRDGLKLVFMNSIRFNEGAPMMEAISRHLESFASGLFEEIMHVPFYEISFNDGNLKSFNKSFYVELIRKRSQRLISVCKMPLRDTEVRSVATCVLSVMKNVPRELTPAIENMMKVLERYFLQWGSKPSDQAEAPILTMECIFMDLIQSAKEFPPQKIADGESRSDSNIVLPALAGLMSIPKGSFPSINAHERKKLDSNNGIDSTVAASNLPSTESSHELGDTVGNLEGITENLRDHSDENSAEHSMKDSTRNAPSDNMSCSSSSSDHSYNSNSEGNVLRARTLPYLHTLDHSIGELLVTLQERLMRGTSRSSVWQRPFGLVWAQPAKSPWWPAMVLASSGSPSFPTLPTDVSVVNTSRIPTSICKQLQKLKAKFQPIDSVTKQSSTSTSSSIPNSTNLTVPEGYYLVEFFGTHDFGWLKQDSTLPMTSDGSLAEFGGKLGCSSIGVKQAIATERWLENERTKYMSPLYRQQYFQNKKRLERMKKFQLKDNQSKEDSSNSKNSEEHSLEEISYSRDDEDSLTHGNDWESTYDNDDEDEEYSEMTRVPTLAELSADVAVLSNPYRDRDRFLTTPSSSSSFSVNVEGTVFDHKSHLLSNMSHQNNYHNDNKNDEDNDEGNRNYSLRDDDDENDENNSDNHSQERVGSVLQEKIKLKKKGRMYCSLNSENKLDRKIDQKNKNNDKNKHKSNIGIGTGTGSINNDNDDNLINKIDSESDMKTNNHSVPKKKSPGTKAKNVPSTFHGADNTAGLRAKMGDYNGLLENGLFLSSVLLNDSYMLSKERAITKTHYFTKWTELVSPVPGGPTFPEQKKRGHKKIAGVGGETGINESEKVPGKDLSKSGGKRNTSAGGGSNKSDIINDKISKDITYVNENGEIADKDNTDINVNTETQEPVPRVIKRRRRRSIQDPTLQNAKSSSKNFASKKYYRALASINAFNVRRDGTKGRMHDVSPDQLLAARTASTISMYPGTVQGGVSNASGVHGSFCILSGGCTNHTAGEGAIHTRTVDMNANIFSRESRFREQRKKILQLELQKLKDALLNFEEGARERIKNPTILSQGDMGVKKKSRNTRTPPCFVQERGLLPDIIGTKVQRINIPNENVNVNSQLYSKINPLKTTNPRERINTGTEGAVIYPLKSMMTTSSNFNSNLGDDKNKLKLKVESGQRQEGGEREGEGGNEGDIDVDMDVETSSEVSEAADDADVDVVEEIDWHWGDKEQKRIGHTQQGGKDVLESENRFASQETADEEIYESEEQNMNFENDFESVENRPRKFHRSERYNSDDEGDVAMVVGRGRDQLIDNNELETEDEADSVDEEGEEEDEEDGGEGEDDGDAEEELEFQSYYRSENNFENDHENDNENDEETADEVEEEEEEMEDEVEVEVLDDKEDDGDENNDRGGIFSIEDEQDEYSDSD